MVLVLALFAVIAMITVFAMTAGVVAPVLAMLTGRFVSPIQPTFFLSPLIPSALSARAIPMIRSMFSLMLVPAIPSILSFPFHLHCRSRGRRLRGWCRSLRQGAGGSQEYDSCHKR